MAKDTQKYYRPGFWCCFFWVLTWLGVFGGLAMLWLTQLPCAKLWIGLCWGGAALAAVISTVIRSVTKNRFDGKKSLHWFD